MLVSRNRTWFISNLRFLKLMHDFTCLGFKELKLDE